ncbi:RNA-directed DNA polymerase [Clavibacter michiganensis]|nr:RNA-directed DNA polymerase [Clavibacter michiganensis]
MHNNDQSPLALGHLQELWDHRVRSGVDITSRLIKQGSAHKRELERARRQQLKISKARRKLSNKRLSSSDRATLLQDIKKRRKKYGRAIAAYLSCVQADLLAPNFKLAVVANFKPQHVTKQSYSLHTGSPDSDYFAALILSDTLATAFGLHAPSRHEAVAGLAAAVSGAWTKSIVRVDISSFYENIPHDRLLELIDSNKALDSISKRWIRTLLAAYLQASSSTNTIGLPRGIGPSANLSEAYLLQFDKSLETKRECIYYSRFVDDIVAVMAEADPYPARPTSYLDEIDSLLVDIGLTASTATGKRQEINVVREILPRGQKITYLGYDLELDYADPALSLDISAQRYMRIVTKMTRAGDAYARSKSNQGKSVELLDLRLKYLTTNTRLLHSKRDAFVGIKFSNTLVNTSNSMRALDAELRAQLSSLDQTGMPEVMKNRINSYSFLAGFEIPKYSRFSSGQWRAMTAIWKDVT